MMYGMAMHNRNQDLCALKKLNTSAALRYHADKVGADGTKLKILEDCGKINTNGPVNSISQGRPGKLTVDNIDGLIDWVGV